MQRGEDVWLDIEAEIMRRNALSYDEPSGLLVGLRAVADEHDMVEDFTRRLRFLAEPAIEPRNAWQFHYGCR